MRETKLNRLHRSYAEQAHHRIDQDFQSIAVPEEWHVIWRDADHRCDRNQKVTLTLDADVVRFFRAMGAGYQPRINRVLRAFMHDRLAGIVAGPEDRVSDEEVAELEEMFAELNEMSDDD